MPTTSLLRPTVLHKAVLACIGLLCFLPATFATAADHWDYEESRTDARDFVAGGMLHIRMSVGDLHIRRGDTNQIRLRYTVKSRHENNLKEAHADLEVHGTDANLEFRAHGSNTAFDVELEVPRNTNLDVHQKVGDLSVNDVEGDKDLSLSVGDIRVDRSEAGYRRVEASTGIGDVNGSGYGETKGWLGKTLHYNGEGKYELRAHVSVGDINLEGK